MFLGGWGAPVDLGRLLGVEFPAWTVALSGWVWLFAKVFFVVSLFLWFRASFPRYRYDQIMRLGWKVFIPITLVWLIVVVASGCRRRGTSGTSGTDRKPTWARFANSSTACS